MQLIEYLSLAYADSIVNYVCVIAFNNQLHNRMIYTEKTEGQKEKYLTSLRFHWHLNVLW